HWLVSFMWLCAVIYWIAIVALLFGWGEWAMPDFSGGFFWVYILAPIASGILAALLFTHILEPSMEKHHTTCDCQ
ncbi:MAG: hypothetical protein ACI3X0_01175, partial [Butyricicoccus sp.]